MKNLFLLSFILFFLIGCKSTIESEWEIAPEIYVMDKEIPINSLEELIGLLEGKQVYIDRWATWCSPCIEEFAYKDELRKFLDSNKIELVYLNSDNDLENDKLYEFIISHDLKGYHLRLNDTLKTDLIGQGVFIPIIPQYMIINKDGKVIENRALRPSDRDSLFLQLVELLDI